MGQGRDSQHPQPIENGDRGKCRHTDYLLDTLLPSGKITSMRLLLPCTKHTKGKRFCPHINDYRTLLFLNTLFLAEKGSTTQDYQFSFWKIYLKVLENKLKESRKRLTSSVFNLTHLLLYTYVVMCLDSTIDVLTCAINFSRIIPIP